MIRYSNTRQCELVKLLKRIALCALTVGQSAHLLSDFWSFKEVYMDFKKNYVFLFQIHPTGKMFILSDGEGKNGTIELMEPVCLSINSVYIIINSSILFGLLLFLILGVDI